LIIEEHDELHTESARAVLRSFVPQEIPGDQRLDGITDA
jgi:hypothetical protein